MDWDDAKPTAPKSLGVGDTRTLSVAELEQRISAFAAEIERVKAELARKRAH